jgi:hypothetical protein
MLGLWCEDVEDDIPATVKVLCMVAEQSETDSVERKDNSYLNLVRQ